jgi:hypothetical protein
MSSWEIAKVPEGTFGPYIGRHGDSAIVLWGAPGADDRAWFARSLDASGKPVGAAFRVGEAPVEVGLVAVRGLGGDGDGAKGFVVLSTSREFSGERVDAITLSSGGKLLGGPTPLAQSLANVVWVDAVPTRKGVLIFWAVKRSGRASLYASAVGVGGDPRAEPVEVVSDARAWQIAPVPGGAAVGVVAAREGSRGGPVSVVYVDDDGALEGRRVDVSTSPTAEPDIDMVAVDDRLVLAWSDQRQSDARVLTAVLGPDTTLVRKPAPNGVPLGPQVLLRLVAPASVGAPAFAVWENALERPAVGRHFHVGRVDADGALSAETATVAHSAGDGSVPEFAAAGDGVAVLTLASACRHDAACSDERVVPTFARLDRGLGVVASEPVRLDALGGAVAELTWGLSCRADECLALAALPTAPAPVYSVRLRGEQGDWVPAVRRDARGPAPRADAIEVVGEAESLAAVAAAPVGDSALVAWITDFDPATPYTRPSKPAPDGRMAPVRAILSIKPAQADAEVPATVISYRARSLGGVVLASAPDDAHALVAWSALENGEPQVFTTLVDGRGKRIRQRMITHSTGSVSGIAATAVDGGYVVAWVDGRHGAGDVYATRLDTQLRRIGTEQRLTPSAGNSSTVQLLTRGEHVFVTWSDARGHDAGVGDIFVGRLSAKDATLVGPATRLTRTDANSHSPVLASFGDGAMVLWVEESTDTAVAQTELMLQRLDSGAEAAAPAESVPLAGRVLATSLACADGMCRVVTSLAATSGAELRAFTYVPTRAVEPLRLVPLESEPRDAIAPVILGSDVYYGDVVAAGSARVRRLSVSWTDRPSE